MFSAIRYAIQSGDTTVWRVNDVTGVVSSNTYPLDREKQEVYYVTFVAYDLGTPSLSSIREATITLLDVNDNTPTFTHDFYEANVSEIVDPNTVITMTPEAIAATDPDKVREIH